MPHFDEHGNDIAICQVCGGDTTKPTWRPDITGSKSAGNVCPKCLARVTSLREAIKTQEQI